MRASGKGLAGPDVAQEFAFVQIDGTLEESFIELPDWLCQTKCLISSTAVGLQLHLADQVKVFVRPVIEALDGIAIEPDQTGVLKCFKVTAAKREDIDSV